MRHSTLFTVVYLLLIFISCRNSSNSTKLTGKTKRFWDVSYSPGYCYEFSRNGSCRYYYYARTEGKAVRKLFPFDDVIVSNSWNFVNDSIIDINGYKYSYKFVNDTLLKLSNIRFLSDSFTLMPSKIQ